MTIPDTTWDTDSAPVAVESRADEAVPTEASRPRIKFPPGSEFHHEVRSRVDAYFRSTGLRPRDCPAMYLKSFVVLAWLASAYVLLVFFAVTWWQTVLLAVLLGLAIPAIGFNVQHDARHQAYSDRAWINRVMAFSVDIIGGSSYVWTYKHNILHHTFTNITGHDSDIELGPFGRVSPHQPYRWIHRFQHFYLWPLYGLLVIKWQLLDDFHDVIVGRLGTYRFPRPRGLELFLFLLGKAIFLTLAFGIPLLFYPLWVVLPVYLLATVIAGLTLSVVFQVAHCVGEAAFPLPEDGTTRMANDFAVHQVETTVDFGRTNRLACWFFGGLNFQIEHHLFPRICHVHYPAMSSIVEQTCREFGVRYTAFDTVRAGVVAHYRWLREMGKPDCSPPTEVGGKEGAG